MPPNETARQRSLDGKPKFFIGWDRSLVQQTVNSATSAILKLTEHLDLLLPRVDTFALELELT